jgi:CRP/FNR family transcriptional regulator
MKTITEQDSAFICDIQSPCFQWLTNDECNNIKASKTQIIFRKGDMLTKQGVFANYVLFIIKGVAKQYIEDHSGKNFNLHVAGPGEFIGLSSVFSTHTFDYTVQALTECQVFLVERDSMKSILESNGKFASGIITRYCSMNRILLKTVHCIQFKQMNGRLAETLLYIDEMREKEQALFQLLSRRDIAEFAGISVESTVKLLKSFESDGLIALDAKNILILNKDKLKSVAEKG